MPTFIARLHSMPSAHLRERQHARWPGRAAGDPVDEQRSPHGRCGRLGVGHIMVGSKELIVSQLSVVTNMVWSRLTEVNHG